MKKVLVTGAAGFVGSFLCKELLDRGVHVTGIDNLDPYYPKALKEYRHKSTQSIHKDFKCLIGDITDMEFLKLFLKQESFDVIFHLAAKAGVRNSIAKPNDYIDTNVIGTTNLLECIRNFAPATKFVMASTSSLYNKALEFKETYPANHPISPYAVTKKAAELMAYTYHHLYGIDVSIVRYFTVYGPAGRPDMSIYKFIQAVLNRKPITVYGDGNQTRDFTFIDDVVDGTIRAAKLVGCELFNLGYGKNPVSLKQVIQKISELTGIEAVVKYESFHGADMEATLADRAKAKEILEWYPKIGFDQGLDSAVEWHKKNNEWLKNLA